MKKSLVLTFTLLACLKESNQKPTSYDDLESHSRIVNGYEVDVAEVPYQAALRRMVIGGWVHYCGAVIVSARAVLTAAHCATSNEDIPSYLRILVGTSYRLIGGSTYEVQKIIIHEEYSETSLINDIAMIVTKSEFQFSDLVQPITFANHNIDIPDGSKAIVSGYGTTEFGGKASNVLMAARVQTVSQSSCSRAYLRIATVTPEMICAHGLNPTTDACQGDSGGPLVANNVLIGLVSWGESCADSNYPGVYTRVSEYNEWISDHLSDISV